MAMPFSLLRKSTTFVAFAAISAFTLVVGATCTRASINGAADKSSPTGGSNTIRLRGLAFIPEHLEVSIGQSVVWINEEPVEHTVTGGTPGAPDTNFIDVTLSEGKTASYEFMKPGTYQFFCRRHPTNMRGEIIVR
ncbi:MAG: hypothetical protein C4318_08795 [Acidimicrobiia bacterium]